MKNYYLAKNLFLAVILICALTATAQHDTIPNPGMENWTCPSYCEPTGWNTDNPLTDPYGQDEISKSTVAAHIHSGTYAAKIASKNVIIQVAPGTITTGTINSSNQTITGGCPMNYRPLKFKLWYQYAPSGTDTFVVNFALLASGVQIGYAEFYTTSTVSAWTQLSLPVTYTSNAVPDQMQIIIASGTGNNSNAGSTAYVDDLSLVDCSTMLVSTTPTATTCAQSNGSAVATATGTTAPYTYLWSNSLTTASISNVPSNTYSVVATDADGCTASATANIAASTGPAVSLAPSSATCSTATGSITNTTTSGTSPYTYAWSNGTTTANLSSVLPGTYKVTVTDSHTCSVTGTAFVDSVNAPFTVTPNGGTTACSGSPTGTVSAVATAGNSPYSYLWSNGATTSIVNNLGSGSYGVTVTDAHKCTTTATAAITTPNGPSATDTVTNVKCFGGNTGKVVVATTGGTSPIQYVWSNGATTATITNLSANTYTLTITDVNSCSFAVSATVSQPATAVSGSGTVTDVTCFGGTNGTITVTPSGGTLPYQESWIGGVTPGAAGPYSVVITDANACTDTLNFTITQPTAISLGSPTITNIYCFGGSNGSIMISPTGGSGSSYTYAWSPNVSTTNTASLINAGNYAVTVTDSLSCTAAASYTVTQPASAVSASVSTTPPSSSIVGDGTATVTASGGSGGFVYTWSNGGTTSTISNLWPDSYCVTVSDSHDCTVSACDSVALSVGITAISSLSAKIYPNPATNQLTIETGLNNNNFQLNIYSLDGKLVEQKIITGSKTIISVSQLTDGLYTYQLKETLSGNIKYGKLQIQR